MRSLTLTALAASSVLLGLAVAQPPAPGRSISDVPPTTDPEVLAMPLRMTDPNSRFADNAFPPTMPDTDWHRAGWIRNDCMRCHETGVGVAPVLRHEGLPKILLAAKCRSCHLIQPGLQPTGDRDNNVDPRFEPNAFPPMMPNSGAHQRAWTATDCLLCHEDGVKGAPIVEHAGLPGIYLAVKCRSCHVQIRSHENDPWSFR